MVLRLILKRLRRGLTIATAAEISSFLSKSVTVLSTVGVIMRANGGTVGYIPCSSYHQMERVY